MTNRPTITSGKRRLPWQDRAGTCTLTHTNPESSFGGAHQSSPQPCTKALFHLLIRHLNLPTKPCVITAEQTAALLSP